MHLFNTDFSMKGKPGFVLALYFQFSLHPFRDGPLCIAFGWNVFKWRKI